MADEGRVDMGMTADAGDVLRALDRIIAKQNKLSGSVKDTQKTSDGFTGSLSSGLGNARGQIVSMAAGFVSVSAAIGVARSVWRGFQEEIKRGAENLKAFQNEFVNIQFLGSHAREGGFRGQVLAEAKRSGLPETEIARGMYTFESMTSHLTGEQRNEQWRAMVRLRKTMNVPLDQTVPTFAKMGSFYPNLSGRELSNISQFMLEKAAVSTPGELSAQAPKMFAAGKVGQMDARTAAAMGAFLTTKSGSAAQAAGAMDILTRKVMLADPDEQEAVRNMAFGAADPTGGRKALMARAGVVAGDNAYQRMMKLGKLDLGPQDLKDLFGEKGLKYGAAALSDTAGLARMVTSFQAATGSDRDIVGGKLAAALAADPTLRAVEAGKRAEVGASVASQRPANLAWDTARKIRNQRSLERGDPYVKRWLMEQGVGLMNLWDPSVGGAVSAVAQDVEGPDADARARRMLGLDAGAMAENLNRATENLFTASQALKDAAAGVADANSQVETPGGVSGGW